MPTGIVTSVGRNPSGSIRVSLTMVSWSARWSRPPSARACTASKTASWRVGEEEPGVSVVGAAHHVARHPELDEDPPPVRVAGGQLVAGLVVDPDLELHLLSDGDGPLRQDDLHPGGALEVLESGGPVRGEGSVEPCELGWRRGADRVQTPDVAAHEGVPAGRRPARPILGHGQHPRLGKHVARLAALRIRSARVGRLEPLRVGGVQREGHRRGQPLPLDDRVVDLVALAAQPALADDQVLHRGVRRTLGPCVRAADGEARLERQLGVADEARVGPRAVAGLAADPGAVHRVERAAVRREAVPLHVRGGRVAAQAPLADPEHVLVRDAERRLVQRIADGAGHHRRRPAVPGHVGGGRADRRARSGRSGRCRAPGTERRPRGRPAECHRRTGWGPRRTADRRRLAGRHRALPHREGPRPVPLHPASLRPPRTRRDAEDAPLEAAHVEVHRPDPPGSGRACRSPFRSRPAGWRRSHRGLRWG